MKDEKRSTDRVAVNSIVQVSPQFDHEEQRGLLLLVVEKHSWGVLAQEVIATRAPTGAGGLGAGKLHRLTWEHIEPTGGKVVWSWDGHVVTDTSQPLRHHP